MFCVNCGTELDSNAKFCYNCGENLAKYQSQSVLSEKAEELDINPEIIEEKNVIEIEQKDVVENELAESEVIDESSDIKIQELVSEISQLKDENNQLKMELKNCMAVSTDKSPKPSFRGKTKPKSDDIVTRFKKWYNE